MINEEIIKEKLMYLVKMNSAKWFDVLDLYVGFEYTNEKISNYDLDVTFDYHGAIDFELSGFITDIEKMSDKLKEHLLEFVITQDGKIVSGKNSNVFCVDHPLIFSIEFKADELHKFVMGYKFHYDEE